MRPDKDAEQIAKEALDWLIALQEEPDNNEIRARFAAWRTASPEHAAAGPKRGIPGSCLARRYRLPLLVERTKRGK